VNAPFDTMSVQRTVVLRVLGGRLDGASHRLPVGKRVRIGHAFDHDIVLRDPSTRGLSFDLCMQDDIATVCVAAGTVGVLGRPVNAGEEMNLPLFVPVSVGNFAIGIGDEQSDRWSEADRLSSAALPIAADVPRADLGERLTARLYPLRTAVAAARNWPLYGAGAALMILVALFSAPASQWVRYQVAGPASHQATLSAAGFAGLTASDDVNGQGPLIRGIVKDDADLARLRAVVADRIGRAVIDVDTMEAMAAAATDILRAQGVDGEAKAMRGNSLLITAEYLPTDRQYELGRLIRRDVPGVSRIAFAADSARGDRDLQYFFSGGSYGLAAFVDGNPGYIVTADGTRWFAGAEVPTGHQIVAIGNGKASFQRDGQIEVLDFGGTSLPASNDPAKPGSAPDERSQS
jgi:type III secretion protein D